VAAAQFPESAQFFFHGMFFATGLASKNIEQTF
jgi:hypothetical protein